MSGIVGSSHNIRGSGIVAKLGTDGQVFTSAGAGVSQIFEDAAGGGLTVAHQWRMTGDTSDNTSDGVITNWEQIDTDGGGVLGSVMSHSSGIFTFPSTGYYWIEANFYVKDEGGDACTIALQTTVNDSSYGDAMTLFFSSGTWSINSGNTGSFLFDVTDTANCKIKFNAASFAISSLIKGSSSDNYSAVTFLRLADT